MLYNELFLKIIFFQPITSSENLSLPSTNLETKLTKSQDELNKVTQDMDIPSSNSVSQGKLKQTVCHE